MEEVRENVREAIKGWLLAEDSATQTPLSGEVIEVAV